MFQSSNASGECKKLKFKALKCSSVGNLGKNKFEPLKFGSFGNFRKTICNTEITGRYQF